MGKKSTRRSKVASEEENVRKQQNLDVEAEADDEAEEAERLSDESESEEDEELQRKHDGKASEKNSGAVDDIAEFEVECIVGERKLGGKTQYRVHWKGFPTSQDTWEEEENLDCDDLLNEYLNNKDKFSKSSWGDLIDKSNNKKIKKGKKRPQGKQSSSTQKKQKRDVQPNENGEFEISRIIDMHVAKNGKHEYLVQWKGFPSSQSSWEPEDNIKDTSAFERFQRKLEEVKSVSVKELRVSRKPTDRFTMSTQATGRRLSRRFQNRQRAKYFEAE